MIMQSMKTLKKDGKQYVKDIFDRHEAHKKAYQLNGVDGLKAMEDDISWTLIEWISILN